MGHLIRIVFCLVSPPSRRPPLPCSTDVPVSRWLRAVGGWIFIILFLLLFTKRSSSSQYCRRVSSSTGQSSDWIFFILFLLLSIKKSSSSLYCRRGLRWLVSSLFSSQFNIVGSIGKGSPDRERRTWAMVCLMVSVLFCTSSLF